MTPKKLIFLMLKTFLDSQNVFWYRVKNIHGCPFKDFANFMTCQIYFDIHSIRSTIVSNELLSSYLHTASTYRVQHATTELAGLTASITGHDVYESSGHD